MSESLEAIKTAIRECSNDDRRALRHYLHALDPHPLERDWGVDADTVLSAIRRSSDLTKRGVRGIIAEAIFESKVLPEVESLGWKSETVVGDQSYDVLLRRDAGPVRIQIKLQRLEKGQPKIYYPKHYGDNSLYVVEVQKTRSGEKKLPSEQKATESSSVASTTVQTRPYRYGDFDILAVNMHPSSSNWKDFRYTLASWLLPRKSDPSLIEIFQPVASTTNDAWTDDLGVCLRWFEDGVERKLLREVLHIRKDSNL